MRKWLVHINNAYPYLCRHLQLPMELCWQSTHAASPYKNTCIFPTVLAVYVVIEMDINTGRCITKTA